jgi:hypothetical protein
VPGEWSPGTFGESGVGWVGGSAFGLDGFDEHGSHVCWGVGDEDAGVAEGGLFGFGGAFTAGDDGSGVAHAAAGRSGGAGDEGGDGFFAVGLDPFGGFFFAGAADFADEDEGVGVGSSLKSLAQSVWESPLIGSPPMPMQVDWPRPRLLSCQTAS